MRTVGVAELKNRLSHYLDGVRRGEEVLIRDRDVPIAKIVPLREADDYEAEELALAASGVIRLPSESLPESFWKSPRPKITAQDAINAVLDERDESRY